MKTLTHEELVEKVNATKGTTIVTIETETIPKTKKGCPPVVKRSKVNGMIGYIYENSVNKQREREGVEEEFTAQERAWGNAVSRFFVSLKDKMYLNIKVQKCQSPEYFSNGERIDKEKIEPFLYQRAESARQEVEKEVIVRNYMLSSLRKITINGETFDIVQK